MVVSWLLVACGETTRPVPGDTGSTPTAGGGGVSSGGATSGASGGGPGPGCPPSQPSGACSGALSCFYPGSTNPCAPPSVTATCENGNWKLAYGAQSGGVCLPEACPQVDIRGCPYTLPMSGTSCTLCSSAATGCTYAGGVASCEAGLWSVDMGDGSGGQASGGAPGEDAGASSGGAG